MRLPLLMMGALFLVALIDDFFIWKIGGSFQHKDRKRWNILWWCQATLCYLVLLTVLCLPRRSADSDIHLNMWLLYSFITVYAAKTVVLISGVCGYIPRIFGKRKSNTLLWLGLPLGSLTFLAMWWGALVTRNQIEVREVNIVSDRIPQQFNGFTIVQLSDMHVGTWGNDTAFVSRLVDSVNARTPDIIFFTGDIVNRHTPELEPFLKPLSRLRARHGVISVLGNHDYGDYITWDNPKERDENNALLAEWEKSIGWDLLNNDHRIIRHNGDSIAVIGVENWGEPPFHQYGRLSEAYPPEKILSSNTADPVYKILLTHNPEHWRQEVSEKTNIDLTLSGHTHAMQTRLKFGKKEWSPAVFKYEEWGGLYRKHNSAGKPSEIYVNIGSGEVGMPFRIGATPEVTVLTLWNSSAKDYISPTEAKSVDN